MSPGEEMFGTDRLSAELHAMSAAPLAEGLEHVWQRVKLWAEDESLQDDVSVVAFEISGA